jgi:predicted DNA-binding transcriptional regulator YafY
VYVGQTRRVRADRLLSLVLLLRHRGLMTASALARELEVSPRTVLRDVDALSTAGVPVYARRGPEGGFALLDGWSTDLTGLTHDEARALLVAGSRAPTPALAAAMRKVVAALPDAQRAAATRAAGRVVQRPERMLRDAPRDTDSRVLRAVQEAVFANRRLRLDYAARGEDEPRRRTVDPVGLVDAGGQWYLLATRDGADRTYRLSRVRAAEVLDEPAAPAGDVDVEALWDARRARFRAGLAVLPARIRLPAARRGDLPGTVTVDAEHPDGDDPGALVLDVRFGDPAHAGKVLWELAPHVELLAPPELRAALADRAAATAARYAAPAPGDRDR